MTQAQQYARLQPYGDKGWLRSTSLPNSLISGPERGLIYNYDQKQSSWVPTKSFFLQTDLFTKTGLDYGVEFWLQRDNGTYAVDEYTYDDPGANGLFAPWRHIAQHTYAYMSKFDIKETHTFWPVNTTEALLLDYLVQALNNGGNTPHGQAMVVYENPDRLKTFFLQQPVNATDKYSLDQMSDLFDLLF